MPTMAGDVDEQTVVILTSDECYINKNYTGLRQLNFGTSEIENMFLCQASPPRETRRKQKRQRA